MRRRRPSPPGKSVAATSWKWSRTDANVSSKRRSTVSASSSRRLSSSFRLCSRSARWSPELGEALLLALVLLFGQRVDAAQRLAAALEAHELLGQLLGIVTFGRFGAGLLDPPLELLRLGCERRELDVDRRGPLAGLGRGAAKLGLLRAELAELLAELSRPLAARIGPRAEAGLEAGRDLDRFGEDGRQPLCRLGRTRVGGDRLGRRLLGGGLQLIDLSLERPASGFELEQHGLRRLARVPELAPLGVVGKAFTGHRELRCIEQLLLLDDPSLGLRAADDDAEVPETGSARLLEERQCARCVSRQDSAGPPGKGGSNRALVAGVDREGRKDEALAPLGQRTGSRRKSLELCQRPLERAEALTSQPRLLAKPLPLRGSRSRRIGPESLGQGLRALTPVLEPLGGALQPVEAGRRLLASPGRADELTLDAVSLREQRLELLARPVPRKARSPAPLVGLCPALLDLLQLELGDPRLDRPDLAAQLLGPLGGGGLQRQRAQALLDLGLEVPGALDIDRDSGELQLRAMAAPLEPSQAGGLLDELAPLLGLRAEDLLDAALADDRAHLAAEPDVGQQLDQIRAAYR